jgi:hypothetical protein
MIALDETNRNMEEAAMIVFKVPSPHSPQELRRTTTFLGKVLGIPAKVRTGHLSR